MRSLIFILAIMMSTGCTAYKEAYNREYKAVHKRLAEMERFNTIHITVKYEGDHVNELEVLQVR